MGLRAEAKDPYGQGPNGGTGERGIQGSRSAHTLPPCTKDPPAAPTTTPAHPHGWGTCCRSRTDTHGELCSLLSRSHELEIDLEPGVN